MIIVTFQAHLFDKPLEEWYSIIVFFRRNPYYISMIYEQERLHKGEKS